MGGKEVPMTPIAYVDELAAERHYLVAMYTHFLGDEADCDEIDLLEQRIRLVDEMLRSAISASLSKGGYRGDDARSQNSERH